MFSVFETSPYIFIQKKIGPRFGIIWDIGGRIGNISGQAYSKKGIRILSDKVRAIQFYGFQAKYT